MSNLGWWVEKPRRVVVVIDNPSWGVAFGEEIVRLLNHNGDHASLVDNQNAVPEGDVAFYLNCLSITTPEILARNRRNLVVHASDLPKGRGFSPLTWMILEGAQKIPVCLIECSEPVDSGDIIYKDWITFEGHELIGEMQTALGAITVDLCMRFMSEPRPPKGRPQVGEPTFFSRRRPKDSELDPEKTIAAQFNHLRTVDNEAYPAFFRYKSQTYVLKIEKAKEGTE